MMFLKQFIWVTMFELSTSAFRLGISTFGICLLMSSISANISQAASYETIYGVGDLTDLSSKVLTGRVDKISSFATRWFDLHSTITIDVSKNL